MYTHKCTHTNMGAHTHTHTHTHFVKPLSKHLMTITVICDADRPAWPWEVHLLCQWPSGRQHITAWGMDGFCCFLFPNNKVYLSGREEREHARLGNSSKVRGQKRLLLVAVDTCKSLGLYFNIYVLGS